jgi:hypothetical protein
MRSYPRNSPHAAARVVALTVLADGHLGHQEIDALQRIDVAGRLDLSQADFMGVLQAVCDDLMASSHQHWSGIQHLPRTELKQMLDEIDDVGLRLIVMEICAALCECDQNLADAEYEMLCTQADHWDLPLPVLRTTSMRLMRSVDAGAVA